LNNFFDLFEKITFHDAQINGLEMKTIIDHFDYFTIDLESDVFIEFFNSNRIKINFIDCFKVVLNAQMWIAGKDSVRGILKHTNSLLLSDVEELNKNGFGPKVNELIHLEIELNISNTKIDVVAKNVEIEVVK
jgi:hypothetical protein